MKTALGVLALILSLSSTIAFAKALNPVESAETQILHALTDMKTIGWKGCF